MATVPERLRQRATLIGCFQQIPASEATEAAAFAGLDFVVFDLEHGLINDERVGTLIRAAEAAGIAPLVRTPDADGARIGRLLDAGAAGIVVPHVGSAAEAEAAVAATRYPPAGRRSAAGARVTGFGRKANVADFARSGAGKPAVIAMVEDRVGVDNATNIVCVDGVDALLVGTTDLSMDVGVPGQRDHDDVVRAVAAVCAAAEEHRVSAGVPVASGAEAVVALERGATFVVTGDVHMLTGALEQFRASALADGR